MTFANRYAIISAFFQFRRIANRLWLRAEVVFDVFPVVAGLIIRAERAARIIAAVHHAMFAARIARDAVDDAILFPLHLREHFLVAAVMAVGHQIARGFPALDVER